LVHGPKSFGIGGQKGTGIVDASDVEIILDEFSEWAERVSAKLRWREKG